MEKIKVLKPYQSLYKWYGIYQIDDRTNRQRQLAHIVFGWVAYIFLLLTFVAAICYQIRNIQFEKRFVWYFCTFGNSVFHVILNLLMILILMRKKVQSIFMKFQEFHDQGTFNG